MTGRALFHSMLLRDYAAHPRTVVLSTHLIEESEALFDRVVIVDRGRIRIDCERDEVSELAFTITGSTDAVERLSERHPVLKSHSVAGLKSVTVQGAATDAVRAEARALGVQVAPASLQELVAAFGEELSEPSEPEIKKGARA